MGTKSSNAVDAYVGSRIRLRRAALGMSQTALAARLGITFQQVQKYEKGTNRVGASRLQTISNILDVPIVFFFENTQSWPLGDRLTEVDDLRLFCQSKDGLTLNRAFMAIKDKRVQAMIIGLVKALAEDDMTPADVSFADEIRPSA